MSVLGIHSSWDLSSLVFLSVRNSLDLGLLKEDRLTSEQIAQLGQRILFDDSFEDTTEGEKFVKLVYRYEKKTELGSIPRY